MKSGYTQNNYPKTVSWTFVGLGKNTVLSIHNRIKLHRTWSNMQNFDTSKHGSPCPEVETEISLIEGDKILRSHHGKPRKFFVTFWKKLQLNYAIIDPEFIGHSTYKAKNSENHENWITFWEKRFLFSITFETSTIMKCHFYLKSSDKVDPELFQCRTTEKFLIVVILSKLVHKRRLSGAEKYLIAGVKYQQQAA